MPFIIVTYIADRALVNYANPMVSALLRLCWYWGIAILALGDGGSGYHKPLKMMAVITFPTGSTYFGTIFKLTCLILACCSCMYH